MILNRSICLYHNGNSQVIDYYRKKFSHLTFSGNWSEEHNPTPTGKLWEICYADVTKENLINANSLGIYVLRHVSSYVNDQKHLLNECQVMSYNDWLNHVVCNNLIFCDEVVSQLDFGKAKNNKTIIITTGRTANSHFQCVLKSLGQNAFECSKTINTNLLESQSAVLMWRVEHWEALASNWLAFQTNQWTHRINNQDTKTINQHVPAISQKWIDKDWASICQIVFDSACFFKLILKRPISLMTTERAISEFQSPHSKLSYNKSELIENYNQTKIEYQASSTSKFIDMLYSRITPLVNDWSVNDETNINQYT
jgi:hypothetical protein